MADSLRTGHTQRDIEQAITTLKKGAYLLKYGYRGKPKFCPFRLSHDESVLIWFSGKEEKQLHLSHVTKIIPGQRTAVFQQHRRPDKEYQSFSLLYNDRSLDLICKDKDEAEVWFVGLKALITRGNNSKRRSESRCDVAPSDSPQTGIYRNSPSTIPFDPGDYEGVHFENLSQNRLGRAFSEVISYTANSKVINKPESTANFSQSPGSTDNSTGRNSISEPFRISLSSVLTSSSQSSSQEDLGDVFLWGEGIGTGIMGGGTQRVGATVNSNMDALLPKALESTVVLDAQSIACGGRHAVIITRQGEVFSWGEESGGRLGHGVEADLSHPKVIETLTGINIELVACGEYHTCAVSLSGDLYTWGDGTLHSGLLGHGTEVSQWIPKKISGQMEGIRVSYISCGPWHTAAVTSAGRLFTFGDGTFGALGHGDRSSTNIPREIETLRGLTTRRVACGVWHTAAVVEVYSEVSSSGHSGSSLSSKLYTWGDGDKGRLGHGNEKTKLLPECVVALVNEKIRRVACGHDLTLALTTSGKVYSMGSNAYGQLGSPKADGKLPTRVVGRISESLVEEIACGSCHVAVLTSKSEVYTWGKGSNGQLGHGDNNPRNTPTLVYSVKDKQVKNVACGTNFTAVICLHKWVSSSDHSVCSGCLHPFSFRRKRHNCYNCGLVFCKACSSRKSLKASLAPNMNKPYRVCNDCFIKLKKASESSSVVQSSKGKTNKFSEMAEKDTRVPKLQATLSRLSSGASGSTVESKQCKPQIKPQLRSSRIFPTLMNGNYQLEHNSITSASPARPSRKGLSASVLASRLGSRAASPVSAMSSPSQASEEILYDSKLTNYSLNQELILLRAQVEDLAWKSQRLEDELAITTNKLKDVTAVAADEAEKCKSAKEISKSLTTQVEDLTRKSQRLEDELAITTNKLKEVTAVAGDEAGKCKSAKEVIKFLTAQLKEMTERLPEGHSSSCNAAGSVGGGQTTKILNEINSENHSTNRTITEVESKGKLVNSSSLPKENRGQSGKGEWVMQDEPGVYLTFSSLPGGGNELKRVQFSRRHFTEDQAEKWWAENGARVCERHNIPGHRLIC